MSLLQDFEMAKRQLGKKEWALIEQYLEEHQDKDLGKVLYWQGEWEKFQEWKIKTFVQKVKESKVGSILELHLNKYLKIWAEKYNKNEYCIEVLVKEEYEDSYQAILFNIEWYNKKLLNENIEKVVDLMRLSYDEIVERYID